MFYLRLVFALALAQTVPTFTPTTPPFVPSPTPGNPENAFDSAFARFEASTQSPLTGEPFTLSLVVSLPDGAFVAEWPDIAGTWGVFDIRAAGDIVKTGSETRQDFTAVLWRPEDAVTPETQIGYSAGGTDVRRVPVRELLFSVPTVIDSNDENLRPPLPPLFAPWPWPLLVMLVGAASAFVVVVWSRRPTASPPPPSTPAQLALNRLKTAAKRPPAERLAAGLTVLRDLNAQTPHGALASAISTGEALAYTGLPVGTEDVAAFFDFAARAVRESARE